MKKKFLSYALVASMAVTSVPTTALADDADTVAVQADGDEATGGDTGNADDPSDTDATTTLAAGNIVASPLADFGNKYERDQLFGAGSYKAEVDGTLTAGTDQLNTIKVYATNLVKFENGINKEGYWCGFSIIKPDGATKMKFVGATTAEELTKKFDAAQVGELETNVSEDGDEGVAVWKDAADTQGERYFAVQFFSGDSGETELTDVYRFYMDLTGVTLAGSTEVGEAIASLNIAVDSEGTISGDTATAGGDLSYYIVDSSKQDEIAKWTTKTALTDAAAALGVAAESGKPDLTHEQNGKILVVVESNAEGYVVAAGESGEINIPVPKTLQSIEVATTPAKVVYTVGDTFDSTGMVVIARYSDNTSKTLTADEYTVVDADKSLDTEGKVTLTIQYTEDGDTKEATVDIYVNAAKTLQDIVITTPPTKVAYKVDETFDPAGMVVMAKYSDGTEVDVTDKVTVAPKTLAAGTTFVTISYTPDDAAAQSFTAKQEVSVFDELPTEKTLVGIAVTKAPTKTEYTVGENFVADGMEVTATYVEDGETKTEVLADDAYTVTGGDDLQLGTTSVTISYTEGVDTAAVTKTATQSITVKAEATLVDIAIKTPPTKTAYTAGENFSTAGMVVMARYSDGTEVDVSKDIEVVGGTGLQVGTTSVTIKYGEKTATQLITVTKDSGTTPVTPGGNTGGGSSGGSGGGGGKSSTTTPTTPATDEKSETTTVTNPDGSTTTTVTNPDGSSVETTTYPDGSKTVTETDENGNQTITETRPDGTEIRTEISRRGEVKSDIKLPEGADEVTVKIPTENRPTAGTVAAIVNPDGTREILLDAIIDRDGVTVTLDKDATIEIFDNAKSFTDVPSSSWAKESIDFVTARELFAGVSDTEFGHNSPMTRAMLMTVLARLDGQDTSGGATWYEKGMNWAIAKGISDGTNPNGTITREQLAAMLYRYAGSPATSGSLDIFLDSGRVSPYAVDALRWAVEQGIISGMGDGTLDPQGNATRAQVAAMLMRFMNAMS